MSDGSQPIEHGSQFMNFDALRSQATIFPQHPDVFSVGTFNTKEIPFRHQGQDMPQLNGFRSELNIHNLNPDGNTAYLIEVGTPHIPAFAVSLLDMGIDPTVYLSPTPEEIKDNEGHYAAYKGMYEYRAEELTRQRRELPKPPKGYGIILNSHATSREEDEISRHLPTADRLKDAGINRLIVGKETLYIYGRPSAKDLSPNSAINRWIQNLETSGIQIEVVGFDYRKTGPGVFR